MGRRVHSPHRSRAKCLGGVVLAGLLLLSAAGSLAACGEEADGTGPAVYTEADDGRSVAAAVGDVLTVRLSENPSTGYSWEPTYSGGLEPGDDEFVAPSASPGLVGAAGTRSFSFVVSAAGTQSFAAAYERPWEAGTVEPAEEFTLTIEAE
jgi:inhibitor of cysteine peptidase